MKTKQIPKKSGGYRTIYIQNPAEKHKFRLIGYQLQKILEKRPFYEVVHGFAPNRSPVTNALRHVGYEFTLSLDIQDFFDNVNMNHLIRAGCPFIIAKKTVYDDATRQGISSSPIAANLAGTLLDEEIINTLLDRVPKSENHSYTRYADDITISSNDKEFLLKLRTQIPIIASQFNWIINPKKTRLQWQGFGNRIICGISVGRTDIRTTRKFRRKLRVANYKYKNSNKTRGLNEWNKLKVPSPDSHFGNKLTTTHIIKEAKILLK